MVGCALNSCESVTPPSQTPNNPNNRTQEWVDTSSSFLSFQGTILCESSIVSQEALFRLTPSPRLYKGINPSGAHAGVSVTLPCPTSPFTHRASCSHLPNKPPVPGGIQNEATPQKESLPCKDRSKPAPLPCSYTEVGRMWRSLAWWGCGRD